MSKLSARGVMPFIYRMSLVNHTSELSDAELLERYIQQKDEMAFEWLLRRFGPMVYGVCRRVLGCPHDAEDAFQATFLVLMQKAHTIKPKSNAGNWLHGVAYRVALKARTLSATRMTKEKAVAKSVESSDKSHDLAEVVDHVLSKLPEKYRQVVLMCDLQGKSRKQVARELGCPEGTVAGRLARARSLMAKRLKQQGLPCAGVLSLFTTLQAKASISSYLIHRTKLMASEYLRNSREMSLVASRVLTLTKGVEGMKAKGLFACLVLTAAALLGFGLLALKNGSDNRLLAQTTAPQRKPSVKVTKPRAPLPVKNQYLVELKVLERSPKGKPDGNKTTIAEPKLVTLEGHEARLVVGGEVMIPGANQLETVPIGVECTVNVHRRKTDRTPVVDFTFSYTKHSLKKNKELLFRRHAVRTIRPIELGKQASVSLAGIGNDGTQIEVLYTIRKVVPGVEKK